MKDRWSLIIISLLVLTGLGCATTPWSKRDVALETTYQVLHFIDWGQTRKIANNPERYYENNPFLGRHPSVDKVDTFMALGSLAHLGITYILPIEYRPYWTGVTIILTGGCVVNNLSLGLGFGW